MGEFFKGWRRKAGCILVVMTLAVCGAWGRTLVYQDRIALAGMSRVWEILSSHERISCLEWDCDASRTTNWELVVDCPVEEWVRRPDPSRIDWHLYKRPPNWCWSCPYWSIVLFMTFDSACLILWKPRKREPQSKQV